MKWSRRTKIGLLMTLLVLISAAAGFALGIGLSATISKKKDNPVFWKAAAMKQLKRLDPTPAQLEKFEATTDKAVSELAQLRQQGVREVWEIVSKAVQEVDQELTPAQREKFHQLKPKPPKGLSNP